MGSTVGRFILNHELKPGTWEHPAPRSKKKAGAVNTPGIHRAGLLVNKPPGTAGLPFV
jgi:hypothetical protein